VKGNLLCHAWKPQQETHAAKKRSAIKGHRSDGEEAPKGEIFK
jgi:hypothetical protein